MTFTVAGFADDVELDRFLKAEIRYLKSSTLVVDRLPERVLLFSTHRDKRWDSYVDHLQASYPGLAVMRLPSDTNLVPEERIYEFP